MSNPLLVRKAPLPWWIGGVLLGLIQVLAVGLKDPLGVSTQFVVVDSVAMQHVAPEYARQNEITRNPRNTRFGYGWWVDLGLLGGALLASVVTLRWRPRLTTVWWRASHGSSPVKRLVAGFVGGFLILLGARLAHGCTSGQFASGWAQLSVAAIPFTIGLFGAGMLTAWMVYPKTPEIER